MGRVRLPRPGDVMDVGRHGGRNVAAHFLGDHWPCGPVTVFYDVGDRTPDVASLDEGTRLEPPVCVGVDPPVREGRWRIVGRREPDVSAEDVPLLSTYWDRSEAGRMPRWYLSRGRELVPLGRDAPEELRGLGDKWTYDAHTVEDWLAGVRKLDGGYAYLTRLAIELGGDPARPDGDDPPGGGP